MAEYSDHLTENEKVLIDGGVGGVHRARVIAQVVAYSEALGLDHTSMQTNVNQAREALSGMKKSDIKRLSKNMAHVTQLLPSILPEASTSQPVATIESDVKASSPDIPAEDTSVPVELDIPDVPEVVTPAEVLAEEVTELDEQQTEASTGDELRPAITEWLTKNIGEEWWKAFGFASADGVTVAVLARLMAEQIRVKKPNTKERLETVLTMWMNGENMAAFIAYNPDVGQYGPVMGMLHYARTRISEILKLPVDDSAPEPASTEAIDTPEEPVATFVPSPVVVTRPTPQPPKAPLVYAHSLVAVNQEDLASKQEVSAEEVIANWSRRLGLHLSGEVALRAFLDPTSNGRLNASKQEVINMFVSYVNEHFGGIDSPELGIDPTRQALMRQMTGQWYLKGDRQIERPPQPLALLVRKRLGTMDPERVIATIYATLDDIASKSPAIDVDVPAQGETEAAQLVVGKGIAYLESMIGPIDGIDISTQDVERICNALMSMADPAAHESTRDVLKGHLLGKSHEDIASETNISVGVVRRTNQALMSWFSDYAQSQLKDAVFDALRRP